MKIIENYYINRATCAIIPIEKNLSKVIEDENTYYVQKSTTSIVDESCKYFGSSYKGRVEGSKRILNMNYKLPIIVEEINNIIFFPTSSPRFDDCIWLSLNNIKKYDKSESSSNSKVVFNCGNDLDLDISFYSLESQVFRSTMLESLIRKRKNV